METSSYADIKFADGGVLPAACQPASDNKPEQNSTASATVSATVASVQSPHHVASVAVASTVFPQTAENGMPKQINWALVDRALSQSIKLALNTRLHSIASLSKRMPRCIMWIMKPPATI